MKLATLAYFLMTISIAKAEPPAAKIVGLGATTCTQFLRDVTRNPNAQRGYLGWAQGFMSGILLSRPSGVDEDLDLVPRSVPLAKQLEFLRTYCLGHSEEDFSDAVLHLYRSLRKSGTS